MPAQRAKAERLVKPLAAQGIRVSGIRLIDTGPAATDLRYFYSGDAQNTAQVVRVLRKLGLSAVQVKHIAGHESRATPRQLPTAVARAARGCTARSPTATAIAVATDSDARLRVEGG